MNISVCIATFNGAKYIEAQLTSILNQLGKDDEVIVSDDSSTDNTIEVIRQFNDNRIKLFTNQNFRSPIFNFEFAISKASGQYIFLSDQDDIWKENKIKVTLDYLKNYNLVVSDCNIIDGNDNELFPSFYLVNKSAPGFIANLKRNSYLGCCLAFDQTIKQAILPFPKHIAMHDIWIGLLTELIGKSIFIPDKLISFRRHTSNFSPTSQRSNFSIFFKIGYRIQFLIYLFLRILKLKIR